MDYDPSGERGRKARDAGIARVASPNAEWMRLCKQCFSMFAPAWEGIAEDWRIIFTRNGLVPTHHNAWGALTSSLLKAKIVEPTGAHRTMCVTKSHKRSTPIYRLGPGAKNQCPSKP